MSVDDDVRALDGLGLQALREVWREHFGVPPKLRSPELMRRCLAWRIQVQAYGGIESGLRRRLHKRVARAHRPHGVRAGGADADLEQIEGADGHADAFEWAQSTSVRRAPSHMATRRGQGLPRRITPSPRILSTASGQIP